MARDFGYVCEQEFPSRHCAEYMSRQFVQQVHQQHSGSASNPELAADVHRRKEMLMGCK